jgi:hypothetical protein
LYWCLADFKEEKKGKKRKKEDEGVQPAEVTEVKEKEGSLQDVDAPEQETDGAKNNEDERMQ